MSFANKHNRGGIQWGIDTDRFEYRKLSDLYQEDAKRVYTCRGLYINKKSLYGYAPVAMTDTCYVNLPEHLLADVEAILVDDDDIEAIKAGRVGFIIEQYYPKAAPNRKCYGIRWVDIQEPERAEISYSR